MHFQGVLTSLEPHEDIPILVQNDNQNLETERKIIESEVKLYYMEKDHNRTIDAMIDEHKKSLRHLEELTESRVRMEYLMEERNKTKKLVGSILSHLVDL